VGDNSSLVNLNVLWIDCSALFYESQGCRGKSSERSSNDMDQLNGKDTTT